MANGADSSSSSNPRDMLAPHLQKKQANGLSPAESSAASDTSSRDSTLPTISKHLKGKDREWEAIKSKTGPLHLLDLPVDVLRLIVKEITHTNDLTALALTNSTLYNLAVPNIYARFDIVWPDTTAPASGTKSVDALTYGLATLCLGSKFAQRTRWMRGSALGDGRASQRLVDNQYARYTRKFSLGNGPSDWTSEYMITKEAGKMLGTLVALAVNKMTNLETFVWDMPTGVLSDVFLALASLQDHHAQGEAKFEKLWVRWHDNAELNRASSSVSSPIQHPPPPPPPLALPPPGSTVTPIGNTVPFEALPTRINTINYSESHVEYPTFSVLPPLKSLTVLDIDELAYLDEMSVLVERSKSSLRELRIGISQKALSAEFAQTWDGASLQQVDHSARWPGESRIGEKRLGGVLGVVVGRIYDIRRKSASKIREKDVSTLGSPEEKSGLHNGVQGSMPATTFDEGTSSSMASLYMYSHSEHPSQQQNPRQPGSSPALKKSQSSQPSCAERKRLDGKLQLQKLELERVALSMQVCTKAIDWSVLTSLTLLDCTYHESLWKVLRRQFQPTPPPHGSYPGASAQYHLALKQIHTDMTSNSLIHFIKETLAPNTLEILFLQDKRRSGPPVTIEQIFKGAIKRHRSSLKKLLLDSSVRGGRSSGADSRRWTNWVLKGEIVSYITSGRMGNLKELAAAFDYNDWHPFLRRLPNIPQLRSLHIPHMLEHISGTFEPKELALQIVDIISLRPEIQLCYLGLATKCFEILEIRRGDSSNNTDLGLNNHHQDGNGVIVIDADDEDDGISDGDETEDEDDANDFNTNGSATDAEEEFTDPSDDTESDADSFQEADIGASATRLRLREILFYDDKVAIFKARHGKL